MMLLTVALQVVLLFLTRVTAQVCDSSLSSAGRGQCTVLTSCSELQEHFRVQEIASFLEQHGCGTESNTGAVLVCCPLATTLANTSSNSGSLQSFPSCGANKVDKGGNWPFHVGLGRALADSFITYCNGVLISPEWVLTEAFCFAQYNIDIALFGLGTADPDQIVTIPIKYKRWPSNYNPLQDHNNIGLAKLETAVQLTDNIQIACPPQPLTLPTPTGQLFALFAATVDDGTGRQILEVLSESKQEIDPISCSSKPDLPIPSMDEFHRCTDAVRFCVNTRPILVQQNSQGSYTLVGVGGLQPQRCSLGTATFTDVSKQLDYIHAVIRTQDTETEVLDVLYQLNSVLSKLPNTTVCGRRIVGGAEWPFLASLGDYDSQVGGPNGDYTSQCTGVFLTPEWILSDANCVNDNKVRIVAMGAGGGFETTSYRVVANIFTPPGYDPLTEHNTVALVQIRPPPTLSFTNHVQPVCRQQLTPYDNKPLLHALSSGYSSSSSGVRLSTNMQIVTRGTSSNCLVSRYVPFSAPDDKYICSFNIRICGNFISNPPVLLEQEPYTSRFTVVGVGGDNENHCHADFMGFVRVKPHLPWIKSVLFPQGDPEDQMARQLLINLGQPSSPTGGK